MKLGPIFPIEKMVTTAALGTYIAYATVATKNRDIFTTAISHACIPSHV